MSLIKGKHSKKYTQIALFIFAIVITVTFIQFRTLAAINVKGEKVYTYNTKAVVRLDNADIKDKAYIVVPDEANTGKFKKLKSESYPVQSDENGQYITVNLPAKTSPDDNKMLEKNGDKYDMKLAFNLVGDNNIASSEVKTVTVIMDTIAPKAESVNIVSSNSDTTLAKKGDIIKLTFTTNEATQKPTVKILGQAAKVNTVGERGTSWSAEYTIVESVITDGKVDFSINFTDLAGNAIASDVTAVTDKSNVTCDCTAPKTQNIKISSDNLRTYVRNGDKITATFNTSEAVKEVTVKILGQPATVTETGSEKGTSWKAEYTIKDDKNSIPERKVEVSINLKDLAGNEVSTTKEDTNVTYNYAPTAKIVNIVSNNSNKAYAKNGDKITITFKTSEPVELPKVTILGKNITAIDTESKPGIPAGADPKTKPGIAAVIGNATSWIAEYNINASENALLEGKVDFSINFKDKVGNEVTSVITSTTDDSKVTYDRKAPKASNVSITSDDNLKNYVKNGQKIFVSFTTDETTKTPNATIFGCTAKVTGDGQNWTAEYLIPVNESKLTEILAHFKIGFADLSGNDAVDVTKVNDSSSVKYDRVAPVVSIVKLASNNKNIEQAKNGDKITAEFTTSESIQKPNVTILGKEADISGSGTSWKAEYIIDGKESTIPEGNVKFKITFKDLANNDLVLAVIKTTDKSSVYYDRTVPLASTVSMVSNNSNNMFAKNGDKVIATFVTSKDQQKPTVKIQGQDALVKDVAEKENTWTAEYTIPPNESLLGEGNLSLSITLLDIANNEAIIDKVTDSSKVTYDRTKAVASTVKIASSNKNTIYAKNADKLTIAFNTSEKVQMPIVTILGKTPSITEGEIKDGTSWIAEYQIKADEKTIKEGKVDFSIKFKDLAGNDVKSVLTDTTDKHVITYDRTAAKATSVKLVSTNSNPKYAKNGDKVTANFTTSEVVQSPKVEIQGKGVSAKGDGKNWTAEYTIAANENTLAEGNIGFSMLFKDLANNEITTAVTATNDNSSVNYDRTVPIASKISVEKVKGTSYAQIVKNGDEFKVKFTLADTNSGINLESVKCQVGKTQFTAPITKGTPQNGEYEAVFTVDSNTLIGIKDYGSFNYVVNFKDVAGNYGLNIGADTGISNDNIAPEIRYFINGVDTSASELKPYHQKNKLMIQVKEHNFDEAQTILENSKIQQTKWVNKGNDIWQMDITVPDGDNYKLKFNVTDKAGNLSSNDLTRERPFNIDTTVPQIKYMFNGTNTDTVSRYYKEMQQVVLQITEHNFDAASTPVTGNGITKTSWKNKGNDIWEMPLNLGEANDYTLNVSTTDKAENKFDKKLGIFTIDITKPALEIQNIMSGFFNGTLSPKVVYSDKNLNKEEVSINFNGKKIGLGKAVGGGFENTVNIKEDGTYDLVASVPDLAGNPSTAEIQFVLDNTAPNIGSTTINLKNPMAYKGGWIIQKELQISDTNGYEIVTCTLNGVDWDISKPVTNEGKNVLYLEAKDKSGNMSKLSYQFFIDNTPPKLAFKDVVSGKIIDNSGEIPVFTSKMNLRIALDKMEIGNEKPDYFTSILLKDKDGNVITDILHKVDKKTENKLSVYYLPLSKFQTYTLAVKAKDQVGNDLNKTYTFTIKDKSIITKIVKKIVDDKPVLYNTAAFVATVIVIVLIGLGIMRINKKKKAEVEAKEEAEE